MRVRYVGGPDTYRCLRSKDLVKWEETSSLPHGFECPEFISMKSAVTGEVLMLLYGCYRSPKDAREPLLKMNNISIPEANAKLQSLAKDAILDVVLRLRPDDTGRRTITTTVRNITIHYESATKVLTRGNDRTSIHPGDTIDARFIFDRGLVESCWNGGEAAYAIASLRPDPGPAFGLEGDSMVEELIVYPMNDARFTKAP